MRGNKQIRCPRGMKVQSLLFSREHFDAPSALAWAANHGFKHHKVDFKPNTIRVRQVIPTKYQFVKSSFRTFKMTNGIKAVIGCPRKK